MDKDFFVQNIKAYCALKGVKPTVACRESGVGTSFITDVNKGKKPSVVKVQMLAQYLGCTVSDLLGERPADMEPGNVIVYADRNGETRKTKIVSDAQFAAIAKILDSLPEEKDEL
jgi:transcriptional regulator with XRE-family HTH domain